MTIGADGCMAGQAAVAEDLALFKPGPRHAHQLGRELAVAHQADFWIDMLALGQGVVAGRRRVGGLFTRVIALMTGVALEVHHLVGIGGHQMATMKGFLLALVGVQGLVPGQCLRCWYAGRRCLVHTAIDDLLVAGQALFVGGLIDGRFEMDRVPARGLVRLPFSGAACRSNARHKASMAMPVQ